jgi:hypothetical protein
MNFVAAIPHTLAVRGGHARALATWAAAPARGAALAAPLARAVKAFLLVGEGAASEGAGSAPGAAAGGAGGVGGGSSSSIGSGSARAGPLSEDDVQSVEAQVRAPAHLCPRSQPCPAVSARDPGGHVSNGTLDARPEARLPVGARGGTRRVRLVRKEGRDVSS